MNLSQIVISLDNAKKLKELGVKMDSYAYWSHSDNRDDNGNYVGAGNGVSDWMLVDDLDVAELEPRDFPAYNASELMELLPGEIKEDRYHHYLSVHKYKDIYLVQYEHYYYNEPINSLDIQKNDNSLHDALALLLIHLIENNYVDPKDFKP